MKDKVLTMSIFLCIFIMLFLLGACSANNTVESTENIEYNTKIESIEQNTEESVQNTGDDKVVDLVLFMGQSNMAGRGEIEQAVSVEEGHGYEFRAVTDPTKLYPVTEPFGENENNDIINDKSGKGENRRAGSMVSALMESYYEVGGVPIVGVQCSQGGN